MKNSKDMLFTARKHSDFNEKWHRLETTYILTILNTLYTPDIKWTIFDFYFLSTVLQGAYL